MIMQCSLQLYAQGQNDQNLFNCLNPQNIE